MSVEFEIRAVSAPWHRGVDLLVRQGNDFGSTVVMEPMPENVEVRPTLSIPIDSAQTLMDDLWNAGIRPTEGAGSAGAMRAAQEHLKDLRAIVFKTMKIEG